MIADILGTGTAFNIKGKLSGYFYEGLLFDKNIPRSTHYDDGKHYVVDVKESSDTEILDSFSIETFNNDDVPLDKLKGDKYLIIEGTPRFGRILTLDDLRG